MGVSGRIRVCLFSLVGMHLPRHPDPRGTFSLPTRSLKKLELKPGLGPFLFFFLFLLFFFPSIPYCFFLYPFRTSAWGSWIPNSLPSCHHLSSPYLTVYHLLPLVSRRLPPSISPSLLLFSLLSYICLLNPITCYFTNPFRSSAGRKKRRQTRKGSRPPPSLSSSLFRFFSFFFIFSFNLFLFWTFFFLSDSALAFTLLHFA